MCTTSQRAQSVGTVAMSDEGGTSSAVETILQAIKREVGEITEPVGITPPLPALSANQPVLNISPYDRRKPPASSYIDRYGRRVFFKEQVRVGQLGRPPITSWTFSKPVQFSSCGNSISTASPRKLHQSPLPIGTNKVISARPKPAPPAVQQPVPPYLMSRVRAHQKRTHQWAVPARAVLDDKMNPKYTQCRLCSETISLRKPGYCVFHVHMHAGYKQYQCTTCDYGHFSMKFVRLHMRRIHGMVDPEPMDMITKEMRTHWGRLALECFPDQLHVCRMLDPNNDAMPDADRDRNFAHMLLKESDEGEREAHAGVSKSLADVLAEVISSQESQPSSSHTADEGSILDEVLAAEKVKKEVVNLVDGLDEAESELWDSEHSDRDKSQEKEAGRSDEPGAKRIKDEPIDEDEQPSCSKDGEANVKDEPIDYDELFAKDNSMPVIHMPLPVSKSGEVMCIACKRAGNDIVMLPSQARNLNVVIAQLDLPVQNRYTVTEHAKMRPGAPLPVCRSHFADGNMPEIEYPNGERECIDGSLIEQHDVGYRPYRFSNAQRRAVVQRTMISQRMAMQKRSDFLDRCAELVPPGVPLRDAEVDEGTGVTVGMAGSPEKPPRRYSTRGTAPQDSDPRYKKCLMCNRSVMNIMLGGNSALVMHAKAHCDLKRYYCPVCGYQSLVERNVIKHIAESHPESRKKPADRNGPAMETLWKNTAIRCFPDAFRIQSGVKARVPISEARPDTFRTKIPHRPIPIQYHIPKPLNLRSQPSMVNMVRRVVPVNRDGTLKRPIVTPKTAVTSRSSDVMLVTSHNAPPVAVRLDGKEDEPLFEAKEEIKEETPDE